MVLDFHGVSHILHEPHLLHIVHVNADYERVDAIVGSDHEPIVARFKVNNGNGKKK